jgi:tRNA nucleotidyltransferase (CCA-adding enzyme)
MSVELARKIAAEVDKVGGSSYFTGGFARDKIMGKSNKDIDIEVYGLWPEELRDLLKGFGKKVVLVGESFGVFKIDDLDVAIPRKEKSTGRSHTSIEVDSDPFLEPEVAARRRDFTRNAIMINVLTGDVLDFFGGIQDIRDNMVRMIDEKTFVEDPLRFIRAAKFAARDNLIISHKTVQAIQRNRMDVKNLPIERVFGEVSAVLMDSPKPSYGFSVMDHLRVMELLLPELWVLDSVEQNPKFHPEGNVGNHWRKTIDWSPVGQRTLVEQLARMWHDVGKLYGTKRHEMISVDIIKEAFPLRLTNNAEIIDEVVKIVGNHMKLYNGNVTRARVKRLASKVDVYKIVDMYRADKFSRGLDPEGLKEDEEHLAKVIKTFEDIKNEVDPFIFGRDIIEMRPDIKPGEVFGKVLKRVYKAQLDDEFTDVDGAKIFLKNVLDGLRKEAGKWVMDEVDE